MNAFIFNLLRGFLCLLLCYSALICVYISFFKKKNFDPLTLFFILSLLVLAGMSLWDFFTIKITNTWKNLKTLGFLEGFVGPLMRRANLPGFKRKNYKKILSNFTEQTSHTLTDNSHIHGRSHLKNTIFNFISLKTGNQKPINHKAVSLALLCLVSFGVGVFHISSLYHLGTHGDSLWQFSGPVYGENTIQEAYQQQQPPLDYYFSSFSHSLFGANKFALRFHAMLFYLLLCLILPLGLWFFCSSLWISGVGAFLFLFNDVIYSNSINGRPLSVALLTGFLFLFFWLSYCNKREEDQKLSLFPVVSSQYLFVMSIGVQPVIFVVTLFLSSFWLLIKGKKEIFKKLFFSNIVTLILTAPIYFKIYEYMIKMNKFKTVSAKSFSSYISNFDMAWMFEKYVLFFYKEMPLFFLTLALIFIFSLIIKKRMITNLIIISSTLLIFPLIFDPLFQVGSKWNIVNRYIIVFSLFLILFVVLVLKEIKIMVNEKENQSKDEKNQKISRLFFKKMKFLKIIRIVPLFVLFVLEGGFQASKILKKEKPFDHYTDNSAKQVYDYLAILGSSKDLVLHFSLSYFGCPRDDLDFNPKGVLFHSSHSHPQIINHYYCLTTHRFCDLVYIIDDLEKFTETTNTKLFLVVVDPKMRGNHYDITYSILSQMIRPSQKFGKYYVFELIFSPDFDKKTQYLQFLSRLLEKTPETHRSSLYETLIYYAYKDKRRADFDRLLEEYRNTQAFLDEISPCLPYLPTQFDMERRIQYFKNLEWEL